MPYVDLPGNVSLWYELCTPDGHPDLSKPSLLLLAPSYLNNLFLRPYVDEFKDDYSVVCLELRGQGRSRHPITATYDFTVAAADIAFFMEALQLPPSHVFGPGCEMFQAALKFSLIWPQHVLSLVLVGAPTLFAVPENVEAFVEIDDLWTYPTSTEDWLDALEGIGQFMLGRRVYPGCDAVWDRVIPTSVRAYNPYKAGMIFFKTEPSHRHPGLTSELLAQLKQPICVMHGDNDLCYPLSTVQEETKHFSGSQELRFIAIEGGPQQVSVTHIPAVIAHMRSFLSRRPSTPAPFLPLNNPSALQRAGNLFNAPFLAVRNPHDPESFSLVTPEELDRGQQRLNKMLQQEKTCTVPLPMCFEKQDWEEGAEKEERFTWSTREDYVQRHLPRRPSTHTFQTGITVAVEESEVSSEKAAREDGAEPPIQGFELGGKASSAWPSPPPPNGRTSRLSSLSLFSSSGGALGGGGDANSLSQRDGRRSVLDEPAQMEEATSGVLQGTVGGSYDRFPETFSPRRASTPLHYRQSSSIGLDPPLLPYASPNGSPSSSSSGFEHLEASPSASDYHQYPSSNSIPRLAGISCALARRESNLLFEKEVDDYLHDFDPELEKHLDKQRQARFSFMAILNTICLLVVVIVLIGLFAGWPIYRFAIDGSWGTLPSYYIVNSSGVVPSIPNLPSLIDGDTPESAYARTGFDGEKYTLAFSDEFNRDGRTFWPGDDPYWEALDLHYWGTKDLEWYDPDAITTKDGNLVIELSQEPWRGLNFRSGMLSSWNKLCFTGGYLEVMISLPGEPDAQGYWPGIWTMGNLGRPGYGGSNDGVWPYSYDTCDVGTLPNQTWPNGTDPYAAKHSGSSDYGGELSWLGGQRLSACTCEEDRDLHPGPNVRTGRVDALEGAIWRTGDRGSASQSTQVAPFTAGYLWKNFTPHIETNDAQWTIQQNQWHGSINQESLSLEVQTDNTSYSGRGYTSYGFEYDPGRDGSIRWAINGTNTWTMHASAIGPSEEAQIDQRPVSEEPMAIVLNLAISMAFQEPQWGKLEFPGQLRVDYVRIYQKEGHHNIGCDPKSHPTSEYIKNHPALYNNPNITVFSQSNYTRPRNRLANGGCG
ncbi:hypothetical protein JCM8097_009200 [Rhodosporidiobolus ruineniae]